MTSHPDCSNKQIRRYAPGKGIDSINLPELWQSRETIAFLCWRDLASRYRIPAVGIAWSIAQPFFTAAVSSLVFGNFAKMPADGLRYPAFCFSGLVVWQYFSNVATASAAAPLTIADLFKKVYLPRLIIPISQIIPPLLDLTMATVVLALFTVFGEHMVLGLNLLALPIYLTLTVITALAISTWQTALSLTYSDTRHLIPFFMQLWMLASPVFYPASIVPAHLKPWFNINPTAAVISGFRWCFFGTGEGPTIDLIVPFMVSTLLMISGMYFYKKLSQRFADVI